jgi:Ser/Thr protein kinase RdoA (MazF antagonist)
MKHNTANQRLLQLLKAHDSQFQYDNEARTWCLFGVEDGNAWETDDYDAETLVEAEGNAIAYLETIEDNVASDALDRRWDILQEKMRAEAERFMANWLTPAEIAAATGTAESTWRNKAAAGQVPGAVKKGKQWLIPRAVLRAQGYNV